MACTLALTNCMELEFGGAKYKLFDQSQKAATYRQLTRLFKSMPPNDIPQQLAELQEQAKVTPERLRASACHDGLQAMDWNEARTLANSGLVEIGAHTLTHRRLVALPPADADHEIASSKRVLEQRLGPVNYFAYPYGESSYGDEHRAMAMRAGYRAIFTTSSQTVTTATDRYAMPRFGIGADMPMNEFAHLLNGGAARANPTP